MLKKFRILMAAHCFSGLCLLFLDISGRLPQKLGFLAKVQLIPAFLAGSFIVVAVLCTLTLFFGRVYCSTLCPLGILQDIFSRIGGKNRFTYSKGRHSLRIVSLLVFVLALLIGIPLIFAILEPYSAFGRIVTNLLAPIWQTGNNLLALASERAGNFSIGSVPVWQKGVSTLFVAGLTLGTIGLLSWKSGRIWCNTLCPAGSILGLISRFSFIRPRINAAKCIHCGLCAKSCKASCIDATNATIDASRCVSCFNCLDKCRNDALAYAPVLKNDNGAPASCKKSAPDLTRRALVGIGLSVFASPGIAIAARRSNEEKEPDLSRKSKPLRATPILPPGSAGLQHFIDRCTGCQLCVSACPNQVLCAFDHGAGALQAALSFEHGYCRINCTVCSEVCPTGAIRPITAKEKNATQIGRAVVDWKRCIITTDKVACVACSRACPTGAAVLVDGKEGQKQLAIDSERCTGCGACEYVCPVHPTAAILVEGNLVHRRI